MNASHAVLDDELSCVAAASADVGSVNCTNPSPAATQITDAASAPRESRRAQMIALLIFALTFAGMARICRNDFVAWDDSFTLYNNPKMNPPTAESLKFYWTHAEHGLYIPGTQTVWLALAKIARNDAPDLQGIWLNSRVFHTASVALHAAAAVVMFLLLRRLLTAVRAREDEIPVTVDIAAAIGALLFALHPVQVESVAWAAGMKDVLYGLFALVSLWQYVVAVQSSPDRPRVVIHMSIATAAFVWAILCKPTAMVVPALAVVIHIAILRGSWRAALKWTAAWWPITLGAMIVARLAQQVDVPFAPLWLRPLVAGDALAFYAGKILWPWKLCIDYGRSPAVAQDGGWIYATWLIPVAIAALLWRKPRREIIAAALLATICVAPVLGLASFMFQFYSTVADHYLYLAMLGPALAVAWIVANDQKYARPVAFVVIGLFAVKSFAQTATWRDDESLFTHTLAVNEKSFVACNNLGGSFDSMGDALVAGAKIADDMGDPVTGRAYRRLAVENFQRARELYVKSIETRQAVNRGIDDHLQTRGLLAMTCSKLKRHDEALAHWAAAAEMINSRLPHLAKTELPKIHCLAAKDLLALRRPADAMRHLAAARALDPNNLAIADTTDQAQRMLATTPLD